MYDDQLRRMEDDVTEKFEVGEIAILQNMDFRPGWNGREVAIVLPLHMTGRWVYETREVLTPEPCYGVQADWLPLKEVWSYPPRYLRKRPPPPNWNALAYSEPRELETII
jgi:hypothetical protein